MTTPNRRIQSHTQQIVAFFDERKGEEERKGGQEKEITLSFNTGNMEI